MMARNGSRAAVGGWLVAVAVAVAVLHATGSGALAPPPLTEPGAWGAWIAERDPVIAAFAVLRLTGLLVAWYLLVMTVLGTGLRLVRARRLMAVVDRLTVPALRRLLWGVAGLSMASGISPALAFGAPAPAAVAGAAHQPGPAAGQPFARDTTTTTGRQPLPTITMRLLPAEGETRAPPAITAPEAPRPSVVAAAPGTWTVRPGECFWSIAEDVLTQAWDRSVTDAEIVPYWRTLIAANQQELADPANPDLVYPSQVFTLPAPPAG